MQKQLNESDGIRVLWTRAREDWAHDQNTVAQPDLFTSVPCLRIEKFDQVSWPHSTGDVLILTSQTAVKCALRGPKGRQLLQGAYKILSFGAKTRRLIEAAGLVVDCPEGVGDAQALAQWLHQQSDLQKRTIWVLGPERPAFPIASFLAKREWRAKHLSLYRTVSLEPDLRTYLGGENLQTVVACFASPSAVYGFGSSWRRFPLKDQMALIAIGFGKSTSQAIEQQLGAHFTVKDAKIEALAARADGICTLLQKNVSAVVFVDGHCNVCNGLVQWLGRRRLPEGIYFASLQSRWAQTLLDGFNPDDPHSLCYLQLSPPAQWQRSRAVLKVVSMSGWSWRLLVAIVVWLPSPLLDLAYNIFAKWRYRLFGKRSSCELGPGNAETQRRILSDELSPK